MSQSPLKAFVVRYDDSSFTNPHTVLYAHEAINPTGRFTHMGAYYEGWEDKRGTGVDVTADGWAYDYAATRDMEIGFDTRSKITHVDVSTKWFTGNNVPEVSILVKDVLGDQDYHMVIDSASLKPDSAHRLMLPRPMDATHAQVLTHQEGGIARIHFFGEPSKLQPVKPANLLTKSFMVSASNTHYGSPVDAVNGVRAEDHMKGWESARTGRGEYALFELERPSTIQGLAVDTYLHRLNPVRAVAAFGVVAKKGASAADLLADAPKYSVHFADGSSHTPDDLKTYMHGAEFRARVSAPNTSKVEIKREIPEGSRWKEILPQSPTFADQFHYFGSGALNNTDQEFTHFLLQHGPNGGMHGLKAYGGLSAEDAELIHAVPGQN